jgi:hypothetical protein
MSRVRPVRLHRGASAGPQEIMQVVERERQIGLYEQELERTVHREPVLDRAAREEAEEEYDDEAEERVRA